MTDGSNFVFLGVVRVLDIHGIDDEKKYGLGPTSIPKKSG